MVKGITRRVIVIKTPDPKLFEEAIFIVREDAAASGGVTGDDIVRQAQQAADDYIKSHANARRKINIPAPVFVFVGALLASAVWFAAIMF
jgi:hypothetical protein